MLILYIMIQYQWCRAPCSLCFNFTQRNL